jgi:hypothetical protein
MSVEHTEETYLWPFNFDITFIFGFQDIENDTDSVLVVVPNDTLVCVSGVRLDDAALLLTCLCRLMIFQSNGFWVQRRWVLSEKQGLYLYKLDVLLLVLLAR